MTTTIHTDALTSITTVQFTLGADSPAGEVSVVGSFNGWTAGVDTLERQEDGTRSATVAVPSGEDVHYRYLGVDGEWFDDPDAEETTPHGCILHLSATPDDTVPDDTVQEPNLTGTTASRETAGAGDQGGDTLQVHTRSRLIPDLQVAGSNDPRTQAESVMSDAGTASRDDPGLYI